MAPTLQALSPLDLAPVAELTPSSAEDVSSAVRTARSALPAWRAAGFHARGEALKKARARLVDAKEEILKALRDEHGKGEFETLFTELIPAFDLFDYWVGHAERILAPELLPLDPMKYPAKRGRIVYEPKGVVAVISPWNYPVNLPIRTIIPALLAGNTVIFKPSEHAVLCGRILDRIFRDSVPPGVFQTVQGDGAVGAALISGGVDHVSFTGSVPTGRKVALQCAERLITCGLELGGKAAAIVLDDADLDRAVNGILWAKFHNAGQNCSAVERIYVHERIAEPFMTRLKAAAAKLAVGVEGSHPMLPLRTAIQRDNVAAQVADARDRGAEILLGGNPAGGLGFEPTIIAKLPADAALLKRETFGPAVGIVPFREVSEAIAWANDSEVGLTASLWTRDLGLAERLVTELDVGVVTVNNACFTGAMPFAPWGGRKQSGHGYTSSHLAIRELVHAKTILIDSERAPHELWWYPYSATKRQIGENLFKLLGGKGGLAEIASLLGLMPRRFKD
jgi:acyl-CoA reductase-like NAD-dependent aldehyde dehydrogenase